MKKLLYTLAVLSTATAFAADWEITGDESFGGKTCDNIIVKNSATISAKSQITSNTGVMTFENDAVLTINNTYTFMLNGATGGSITGTGKDKSIFNYTGYHLSAARDAATRGCQPLTFKDVTINYNGSYGPSGLKKNEGMLRAGAFLIDAANVNMLEGRFSVHKDSTITETGALVKLTNGSTLSFADVSPDGTDYVAAIHVDGDDSMTDAQRTISLSGASKLVVGNSLNAAAFNISAVENSTITAKTLTNVNNITINNSSMSIANKLEAAGTITTVGSSSVNVAKGGTLSAAAWSFDGTLGVDTVISGGSYTLEKVTRNKNGDGKTYVTAESLTISSFDSAQLSNGSWFVGLDKDGNTYDVNLSSVGMQFNSGKMVADGKTILNFGGSTANFADTSANANGLKNGVGNYFGKDVVFTAGASRINGGYLDGTFNVSSGYVNANNWNYTLALGVNNQYANIILGENVKISVVGNNKNSVGKNFVMTGNIVSNAATGSIVSDANAGFYIKKDTKNTASTLTLNTTDAFAVGGAATQGEATFKLESGAELNLLVNADNNLKTFLFDDSTAKLNIGIAKGKVFTIGNFANSVDDGVLTIALDDYIYKGSFRIMDMDSILADYDGTNTVKFVDGSGNGRVLNVNLYIEKLASGGYDIYTQVPEPSTVAAIFGALALALAMYRRRK